MFNLQSQFWAIPAIPHFWQTKVIVLLIYPTGPIWTPIISIFSPWNGLVYATKMNNITLNIIKPYPNVMGDQIFPSELAYITLGPAVYSPCLRSKHTNNAPYICQVWRHKPHAIFFLNLLFGLLFGKKSNRNGIAVGRNEIWMTSIEG